MMSMMVRQIRYSKSFDAFGFGAKVIGIGVFAGLMLTYCNALLDACMSGIR
jgi:hypothetical protein